MLTKYRTEGEDAAKFQQLKYLVAVAEYGSITEAARRLFVSQPRITASIRDLEREMGVPCSSAQARASLTPTKVRRFSATPTKFSIKP
ncbi:helix-turn-helix domain-containing protein, partial [Slackia piriformis]|uniref:helix-turn-helix domain-containing protein n=1 Tax=Slackia piriformis TaxID=626934 RepID=UPI0026DA7EA6